MKLLLADDEVLTRSGLIQNIDWQSLGIHQVLEADDGFQALSLAKKHEPEIIMTDIRMPRMNGVEFAERIREFLPHSSLIFMSGYTDKEYLQAAIRMKAVSYVEKPFTQQDVLTAVAEAIHSHKLQTRNAYLNIRHRAEQSDVLAQILTRAALPGDTTEETAALIHELALPFDAHTWFQTLLLQTFPGFSSTDPAALEELLERLRRMTKSMSFDFLCTRKHSAVLIFHIYSPKRPALPALQDFCRYMTDNLDPAYSWFLAVGPCVQGYSHVYESYNEAAVLLQSGFFHDYNTILWERSAAPIRTDTLDTCVSHFSDCVSRRDTGGAVGAAQELFRHLQGCQTMLPSNAKDIYFKLFIALEQAYRTLMRLYEEDSPIWDRILSCHNLADLQGMLLNEITRLEYLAQKEEKDSGPVSIMKDYIHKNYAVDILSVKDISSHAGLSVAYACTLFKSETGTTLNQYLTNYRIEKACQLLADSRIRIADISARVGYTDGSYFGKSFKKNTGLTPSEYREKLLS